MFKIFKEKLNQVEKTFIFLGAPIEGKAVSLSNVKDAAFADEILGKGIAVKPCNGKVIAPIDGKIDVLFNTKHSVTIISDEGIEILIHIGIDTLNLKGEYFKAFVKAGDIVKRGDLLIEFDINKIEEAGYDTICPIVICNSNDFIKVEPNIIGEVKLLDKIIKITK